MAKKKDWSLAPEGDGLPPDGDTSLEAVAARLRSFHAEFKDGEYRGFKHPAKMANCTAAEWRSWESGKALMPRRHAFFIAWRSWDYHSSWYPVSWFYTGSYFEPDLPEDVPSLPANLSGFAKRLRDLRESHGVTLADMKALTSSEFGSIVHPQWQAFEAGIDEPNLYEMEQILSIFEIDAKSLYNANGIDRLAITPAKWPNGFKPDLFSTAQIDCSRGDTDRIASIAETAGISAKVLRQISGKFPGNCAGSLLAIALLCNVPLESLIFRDDERISIARRVERFKRMLGITPPRKRRKPAA